MIASTLVYAGVIALVTGLAFAIKPIAALRVRTRRRGLAIAAAGAAVTLGALLAPAFESRVPSTACASTSSRASGSSTKYTPSA